MEDVTSVDALDRMEQIHLSDTLELRACLERREKIFGSNELPVQAALAEVESFVKRLSLGTFHLRPEEELSDGHHSLMQMALAAVSDAGEQALIRTHSLKKLLCTGPEAQSLIYGIAQRGSVGALLRSRQPHAELLERADRLYVPYRLISDLLSVAGLPEVLRCTKYGLGFSVRFQDDIATFFTCVLAHACRGNDAMVRRLLPLAKIFRSNMPIGLLPATEHGQHQWHVFTA